MGGFRGAVPELATIRESRGITLKRIAQSTKIGVFYLRAIEKGEIHKLPGGIYTKNYIRQYARAIDYCEHDLLEKFGISCSEEAPFANARPPGVFGPFLRFMALIFHPDGTAANTKRTG